MKHSEMIEILRESRCDWSDDSEIADMLDFYREIIRRCERRLPPGNIGRDIESLRADIAKVLS